MKNTKKVSRIIGQQKNCIDEKIKIDASYIGKEAFLGNEKIKEVKIGPRISQICSKAFSNCKNLSLVFIDAKPRRKIRIADDAFVGSCNARLVVYSKGFGFYKNKYVLDYARKHNMKVGP